MSRRVIFRPSGGFQQPKSWKIVIIFSKNVTWRLNYTHCRKTGALVNLWHELSSLFFATGWRQQIWLSRSHPFAAEQDLQRRRWQNTKTAQIAKLQKYARHLKALMRLVLANQQLRRFLRTRLRNCAVDWDDEFQSARMFLPALEIGNIILNARVGGRFAADALSTLPKRRVHALKVFAGVRMPQRWLNAKLACNELIWKSLCKGGRCPCYNAAAAARRKARAPLLIALRFG